MKKVNWPGVALVVWLLLMSTVFTEVDKDGVAAFAQIALAFFLLGATIWKALE